MELNNIKLPQHIINWLQVAQPDEIITAIDIGINAFDKIKKLPREKPIGEQVNQSSCVRGQVGENYVFDILSSRFKSLKNVTKDPQSGDIQLFVDQYKIIVEIKNYTSAIPKSNIEKFKRDLVSTNAYGGIFISLNTPITGYDNFEIVLEHTDKIVPCIYMSSNSREIIMAAVNIIINLINTASSIRSMIYNKDILEAQVSSIDDNLEVLARSRNDLCTTLSQFNSQITKNSMKYSAAEFGIKNAIDIIKRECYGGIQYTPDIFVEGINPSDNIKKLIGCIQKYNTKQITHCWKLKNKKIINTELDIIISTGVKNTIAIPQVNVPIDIYPILFDKFTKKIIIDSYVNIVIDDLTVDNIIHILDTLLGVK